MIRIGSRLGKNAQGEFIGFSYSANIPGASYLCLEAGCGGG